MKHILILRHGKAEAHRSPDFGRALLAKGERRTRAVVTHALGLDLIPDRIVTSPAPRARDTALIATEVFGLRPRACAADRDLYDCVTPESLWRAVLRHVGDAHAVLVCGHNPGLSLLAAWLCPGFHAGLPKSSLTVLASPGHRWADVRPGTAELVRYLRPDGSEVADPGPGVEE